MTWSFGYGVGSTRLEEGIRQAGEIGVDFVEFNADVDDNAFDTFDDERIRAVRSLTERTGLQIAIHTDSGVNTAEFTPFYREAAEAYLRANIDLAAQLGCSWIVVHAGHHFLTGGASGPTSKEGRRRDAAVKHLREAAAYAEQKQVLLILENRNREPEHAEMSYFPYTAEDQAWFMEQIPSPNFGWSFNTCHAHLVPEGVGGYIETVGVDRLGQLRLCDGNGMYEEHLVPGQGSIDFDEFFRMLVERRWEGPCHFAFKGLDERLAMRDRIREMVQAGSR